jgi:hypothetical protein
MILAPKRMAEQMDISSGRRLVDGVHRATQVLVLSDMTIRKSVLLLESWAQYADMLLLLLLLASGKGCCSDGIRRGTASIVCVQRASSYLVGLALQVAASTSKCRESAIGWTCHDLSIWECGFVWGGT